MTLPCQCSQPGYCDRYRREMTPRRFVLCVYREDYRKLWDGVSRGENQMPSHWQQAWNAAGALAAFLKTPDTVERDVYERRLAVCDQCPRREDRRCSECGCGIDIKAKWKVFDCPLGYWKDQE